MTSVPDDVIDEMLAAAAQATASIVQQQGEMRTTWLRRRARTAMRAAILAMEALRG